MAKKQTAPEKMTEEKLGVGTTKVNYGPADIVDIFGVAYTFAAGSQTYQTLDS